ncbi:MAG: hypothetical protein H0W44_10610 [Gammaproteobacteria bacterium]|nr:hypothetical protein [Gammaproteobacteria bacterium]
MKNLFFEKYFIFPFLVIISCSFFIGVYFLEEFCFSGIFLDPEINTVIAVLGAVLLLFGSIASLIFINRLRKKIHEMFLVVSEAKSSRILLENPVYVKIILNAMLANMMTAIATIVLYFPVWSKWLPCD